jgi:malonyl-CoA/methylmalonyl-CoA synthetase
MPHIVHSAIAFGDRPAIHDAGGSITYAALHARACRVAGALLANADDLHETRIAVLVTPGAAWVAAMWGVWAAGGIAVPLSPQHPAAEWAYALDDADATALIVDAALHDAIAPLAHARRLRVVAVDVREDPRVRLPVIGADRRAMMLYTSGTTGRPKGVVHTHGTLAAQIASLVDAWAWAPTDHTLLVLPLHHVHGIVNVTCCALAVGAQLTMHARFDAATTWALLHTRQLTSLHAVPTIWARLLAAYDVMSPDVQQQSRDAVGALRLIVSGSAALPVPVLERWRALSGHTLLERYGMTEIGMALSNPLHGVRVPGHVGMPLPGVEVRAVDDDGRVVPAGTPGALEVRGPGVMREYWRRDAETVAAFRDGWFHTGDVGVLEDTVGGTSWRLLGRQSTDILKTGGYKVSALEIEDVVREHDAVAECAVVGLPDEQWGERVAVAVELRAHASLTLDELRAFLKPRLAPYKIPSALVTPEALPRNAMGKVLKPAVRSLFAGA